MGGGGKGGAAPPAAPAVKDYTGELAMLQNQIANMSNQMAGFNVPPPSISLPEVPGVEQVQAIDWAQVAAEAGTKASTEFNAESAVKKGRSGTILTNPLLDTTSPETTGTILG